MCRKKFLIGSVAFSRNITKRFYSEKFISGNANRKKFNENRALAHFDYAYSSVYGKMWPSIRAALLTKHKHVALVNNFADPTKTCQELELSGAVNLKSLLEPTHSVEENQTNFTKVDRYDDDVIPRMSNWLRWSKSDFSKYCASDVSIKITPENDFCYPENLLIYSFKSCDVTRIQKVKPTENNKRLSHFAMNGSSIFPPLMLNIQPKDKVYDACASPGGKSLLLLQTLVPMFLVCNDIDPVRIHKVKTCFSQFLVDYKTKWSDETISLTTQDACSCSNYGLYDKILVDVPCTTDRDALKKRKKTNFFEKSLYNELINLPEIQTKILSNCIKLLKPGGSLVYSTCSLSPVQNDGVVRMAISKVLMENAISVTVKDLTVTINPFRKFFTFHDSSKLKYGQLVLPRLTNNFGPLYFSKITRGI